MQDESKLAKLLMSCVMFFEEMFSYTCSMPPYSQLALSGIVSDLDSVCLHVFHFKCWYHCTLCKLWWRRESRSTAIWRSALDASLAFSLLTFFQEICMCVRERVPFLLLSAANIIIFSDRLHVYLLWDVTNMSLKAINLIKLHLIIYFIQFFTTCNLISKFINR